LNFNADAASIVLIQNRFQSTKNSRNVARRQLRYQYKRLKSRKKWDIPFLKSFLIAIFFVFSSFLNESKK
jgi:hypothetical protein